MKGTNLDMDSKLDISIRTATRDDVGKILEIFETVASSQCDEIPLDSKRLKLTPNGLDRDGFDTRDRAAFFHSIIAETVQSHGKKLIVGAVIYHWKYSTWVGQVIHLGGLAVEETFRRKGIATKLMQHLGKVAVESKFPRISFEVSERNKAAMQFFTKLGATNLSKEEGWLNYTFTPDAVVQILQNSPESVPDEIIVRRTEPKDCASIRRFIQDLADFEQMPDGPKLSVENIRRSGFYELWPHYGSFVGERTSPDTGEKEVIGYSIFFPTYSPYYGKRIHLEDIYVAPDYRSKGVATLLFNAVAKYCHDNGFWGFTLECLDWNTTATKFYEKRGGENVTKTQGQQSHRFFEDSLRTLGSKT